MIPYLELPAGGLKSSSNSFMTLLIKQEEGILVTFDLDIVMQSLAKYKDIEKLTLCGTKERIPTLEEVLKVVDGKVPILITIKNFGKVGIVEKAIWKVLQNYSGEYAVESLNPYTLEWFKKNAPKVKRGQVSCFFKNKEITGVKTFSLKRMLLNKKISEPNFIVYNAEDMPNKYVKKYFGKLPVLVYTIKSLEEEDRLKDYCDNIVFDSYTPTKLSK